MQGEDPRPDELLERCGRLYWRLNLAIAWTDGLADDVKAKTCSRGGSAAWKAAKPLREQVPTEEAAAAFFKTRGRSRNPATAAVASTVDLVEYDGGRDELDRKHGIPRLPDTLGWQSRRGPHMVFKTPPGEAPVKIQVDADGVTVSSDGYLVCAPAWRKEYGVVYELNGTHEPVELPHEPRALLLKQGAQKRAETRRRFKEGEPIPKGDRNLGLFWLAVDLLRAGTPPTDTREQILKAAREQCRPPLEPDRAREQFKGAVKFVAEHPTETERARAEARRVLDEHQQGERTTTPRVESTSTRSTWEEPVPLAGRGAPVPFPIETLLGWTASWATAISAEKGAALDLGASLALDVVAGAIARNVQVSPRPGWYEPTNLYSIVALAPGQRKTPVFKAALRPVQTLERRLIRDWEEQQQLVAISTAIFDKRRKELIDEAADDDQLDTERLRAQMDAKLAGIDDFEQVPRPRLLTEDVTPEALAGLLADHGRIIAASDEGAAIFENLAGRYARGSTSWDVFNKAHSASTLRVDRRSSGLVIVFEPAVTLAIATQPEVLLTLAGKPGAEGRGVLARPLYALPAPVYVQGTTPAADPEVLDEYERRILNLYNDTPGLETDEDDHPRPTILTLDDDAREAFERFELELNRERQELGGDDLDEESVYLGWLSKLAGQTARLAATLHVADHWTRGAGAAALVIDKTTVARAITLARYYRKHALAVFGLMGELPEQRRGHSILRWLHARTPEELAGLTIRDVQRSRGKGTKVEFVRVALRLLEEHGYVRLERPPRRGSAGRPSERILVHPQIENPPDRPDKPDTGTPTSGVSGLFSRSPDADEPATTAREWLARDGAWRSYDSDPPALAGEVLEERDG